MSTMISHDACLSYANEIFRIKISQDDQLITITFTSLKIFTQYHNINNEQLVNVELILQANSQ